MVVKLHCEDMVLIHSTGTSNATYMVSLPYPAQDMYVAFDTDQNHLATMKLHHREEQYNDARDKCRMYIKK